jgi:hypothetical protein
MQVASYSAETSANAPETEEVYDQVLMHIRGVEVEIKSAQETSEPHHRDPNTYFRKLPEPVLFHLIPRLAEGLARHFSAELPVPKVKTAIVAVCGGRNDISSQRQCYWACYSLPPGNEATILGVARDYWYTTGCLKDT